MSLYISPPQGKTEQGLQIIGKPLSPNFKPPQGLHSTVLNDLLLDLYPGARAAYSLRQLSKSAELCMLVVDDSSTKDIGFKNGLLDIDTLEEFAGDGDVHVVRFYDQTGNGYHLDGGSSSRPMIVQDGVLIESNGKPAMIFDGVNDIMIATQQLPTSVEHIFIFGIWAKLLANDNASNFNLNNPLNNTRVSGHATWGNGIIYWDAGNSGSERLSTTAGYHDIIQHQYTFIKTNDTNGQKIKRDGVILAQKTQVNTPTTLNFVSLGNATASTAYTNMSFQELIFYDSDIRDDVDKIEIDQFDYYSIENMGISSTATGNVVTDAEVNIVTDEEENIVFV